MIDLSPLRAALKGRAGELAIALLGSPNWALSSKSELRFGRKGSLVVEITGRKVGLWRDHETGAGGDLFALIMRERGGSFRDALEFADQFVGLPQDTTTPRTSAHQQTTSCEDPTSRVKRALALWRETVPIAGTLGERYLAARGISDLPPRLEESLRFHPACPFGKETNHPCLVGLLVDVRTNEPRAVHRTALTPDAQKLGRRTLGPKAGACIKLSPDDAIELGLFLGEGLETTLSGMQLGFRPAWACGDAGNLAEFPLLPGIECLSILVDHDPTGTGQRAAAACAQRWADAGVETYRLTPKQTGMDFNDLSGETG